MEPPPAAPAFARQALDALLARGNVLPSAAESRALLPDHLMAA